MKKIILTAMSVFILAVSSLAFAADEAGNAAGQKPSNEATQPNQPSSGDENADNN